MIVHQTNAEPLPDDATPGDVIRHIVRGYLRHTVQAVRATAESVVVETSFGERTRAITVTGSAEELHFIVRLTELFWRLKLLADNDERSDLLDWRGEMGRLANFLEGKPGTILLRALAGALASDQRNGLADSAHMHFLVQDLLTLSVDQVTTILQVHADLGIAPETFVLEPESNRNAVYRLLSGQFDRTTLKALITSAKGGRDLFTLVEAA